MSGEVTTSRVAFGQLLRRVRRASGLSLEELGERAGVGVRTISDLERGRTTRPYRQTVGSLAKALGLRGPQLDEFVRLSRQGREPMPADDQPQMAGQPGSADVPRQLPAAVSHFAGRKAEFETLTGLLSDASETSTVVISALAGTAGVGKTALAVHWAHQVAERFPGGQLYVNLRGYDPHEPAAATDALAGFLQTLGVPGPQIPDDVGERARLYRSKLAGRRVLVVLDNARDGEQVRPLLPGDPGCAAVVTSRDALAGLVATDGARRLSLDVLPAVDAVGLLRELIGSRVDADPEAAAALAGLCARLPLALRIAAELAAARRESSLRELVADLTAARLDGLDAGEDRADVRAVFSWSVRHLPGDIVEAFALVGLHPGEDLDAHAVSALTGTSVPRARRVLAALHRASLVQAAGAGRYGMHDLLRAYARELAAARDTAGQQRQALTGLFDYYLAAAAAAMDVLVPSEADRRPRIAASSVVVPEMAGQADARALLDRERANIVAVVVHCAGNGWPGHAVGLATTLFRYLMDGSYLPDAQTIYGHALQAARRSGDLTGEARALNGLGSIGLMKGHFREAADYYQAALDSYRRSGDRASQAGILHNLGMTEYRLHNHVGAADYYRQAIAAFEDTGDSLRAASALADLAGAEIELGMYDQAAEHLQRALPVVRAAKDYTREAATAGMMGELSRFRGQLASAAVFFEQALGICRRTGNPSGVGNALLNLGQVSLSQVEFHKALDYQRQALDQFRQAGNQYGELLTLRGLAEALRGLGEPAAAHAELETALRLAADTGNTYEQATVHRDLAESHQSASQNTQARRHWQLALDLYTQLGAPEADQVRSRLNGLSSLP